MTNYNSDSSTTTTTSSTEEEDTTDVIGTMTTKYVMELKDLLSTSRWVRIEYYISLIFTILIFISFVYMLYKLDRTDDNIRNDDNDDTNNDNTIDSNEHRRRHKQLNNNNTTNDNNNSTNDLVFDEHVIGMDSYLEVEKDCTFDAASSPAVVTTTTTTMNSNTTNTNTNSISLVRLLRKVIPYILQVLVLLLFSYLLLVSLSGIGYLRIWLSLFSISVVFGIVLFQQIQNEIRFYQRYDRIVILITLFLQLSAGLCFISYCSKAINEGQIYSGPARIIAYDAKSYNNTDGITLRANVKVSWGGSWGCSESTNNNINEHYCVADVNATLCETKYSIDAIQQQYLSSNEDYDQYIDQYNEQAAKEDAIYNKQLNDTETKGFTGTVVHETTTTTNNNNTNTTIQGIYYSGENGEDVYITTNGTTDTVDIAFKDTSEQVQVQKNIINPTNTNNNNTTNSTSIDIDFTNTNSSTYIKGKEQYIDTSVNPNNTSNTSTTATTNGTKKNNQHHYYYQRNVNEIDDTIATTTVAEKVDEISEQQKEDAIKQKGIDEVQEYNEVVNDYITTEEGNADTVITVDNTLEQVQQQNIALKKENVELQTIVTALQKKYNAEIETENQLNSDIQYYEYDTSTNSNSGNDDYSTNMYDNIYWNSYDWDSIWGSYECADMFNYDLAGSSVSYNPSVPPNKDTSSGGQHWPTMNIYGSCKTCTAYIMDYYSTEHFQSIHQFRIQGYYYLLLSFGTTLLSLVLYYKHLRTPRDEHKLVLLSDNCSSSNTYNDDHHDGIGIQLRSNSSSRYSRTTSRKNNNTLFNPSTATNNKVMIGSTSQQQQQQLGVIA